MDWEDEGMGAGDEIDDVDSTDEGMSMMTTR